VYLVKKARKTVPVKMKAIRKRRLVNVLVVSKPVAMATDEQNVRIFPRKKKMPSSMKNRYALVATNRIYPMKARKQKLLKLKSRRINVKLDASV